MVQPASFGHHAGAHEESVEEDTRSGQRQLRQFQEDACLYDKIHALCSTASFFGNRELVKGGGSAVDLGVGEEPLA